VDALLAGIDRRVVLAIFLIPLLAVAGVILFTTLRDSWRERRDRKDEER
jgi:hypothetical protein